MHAVQRWQNIAVCPFYRPESSAARAESVEAFLAVSVPFDKLRTNGMFKFRQYMIKRGIVIPAESAHGLG